VASSPSKKAEARKLRSEGWTQARIAERFGVSPRTVRTWLAPQATDEQVAQALHAVPLEPPIDISGGPDSGYRDADVPPTRPVDGTVFVPPTEGGDVLNYKDLEEYIAGAYRMGAKLSGDMILIDVVNVHANEAARAWAEWIRSEPKVAAWLQRMMIGTPAGKLIYIHVSMGVGYVFAKSAAAELQRRRAADESADATADVAFDGAAASAA